MEPFAVGDGIGGASAKHLGNLASSPQSPQVPTSSRSNWAEPSAAGARATNPASCRPVFHRSSKCRLEEDSPSPATSKGDCTPGAQISTASATCQQICLPPRFPLGTYSRLRLPQRVPFDAGAVAILASAPPPLGYPVSFRLRQHRAERLRVSPMARSSAGAQHEMVLRSRSPRASTTRRISLAGVSTRSPFERTALSFAGDTPTRQMSRQPCQALLMSSRVCPRRTRSHFAQTARSSCGDPRVPRERRQPISTR
jgi:hypothetical protein